MTMTAIQIREALKPMMQFAPAITSCIEIVESAEAAEKAFAKATKEDAARKKALSDEIDALENVKAKLAREVESMRKEASAAADDLAAKKTSFAAALASAKNDHDNYMAKLGDLGKQYADEIAKIEAQKIAKQNELDTVKKGFEAFKVAHKL